MFWAIVAIIILSFVGTQHEMDYCLHKKNPVLKQYEYEYKVQKDQLKEEYEINFMGIGIDPHNADGVLADLEAFGCPVVVVVQSARSLNDATADFQLSVKSHKLEYNKNNELLTWSAVNAVVVRNSFDEMKIDKKVNQHHKRIDPIDACINAHTLAMQQQKENPVNVEDEMTKYLDMMGWS